MEKRYHAVLCKQFGNNWSAWRVWDNLKEMYIFEGEREEAFQKADSLNAQDGPIKVVFENVSVGELENMSDVKTYLSKLYGIYRIEYDVPTSTLKINETEGN